MSGNPYQAPGAPVADAKDAATARPPSVVAALVLLAIAVLLTGVQIVANLQRVNTGEMSGVDWLLQIVGAGALVVAGIALFRRQGWARWLLLVLALWRVAAFVSALAVALRMYGGVFSYISSTIVSIALVPAMLAVAAWLVLVPARAWFARS